MSNSLRGAAWVGAGLQPSPRARHISLQTLTRGSTQVWGNPRPKPGSGGASRVSPHLVLPAVITEALSVPLALLAPLRDACRFWVLLTP